MLPTIRWGTNHPTLAHDTIENVLCYMLHGQNPTSDILFFTQQGTPAERLAELLYVTEHVHRVATDVKIPRAFQFVPKNMLGSDKGTWWYTCLRPNPYLPHRMNMIWGPLLRQHRGALHTPSLSNEQHVYDRMHHQKIYFDLVWEKEVPSRRDALRQRWNAKLRRVNTHFQWEAVPGSIDMVNEALQFATQSTPRKNAAPRRTWANVTAPGTWVYVMWFRRSSKVYVGKTGGKGCVRTVFERFRDHILPGRDWTLLDKWTKTFSVPVYEWVKQVGLDNVCITPMEFYAVSNVDERERYWMCVFGIANLLNECLPSLNHDKWPWLYRIKNAVKMAKSGGETQSESLRARAGKFLQDRSSIMPLHDQFDLLLRGKKFLPEHVATPLVKKLEDRIARETGLRALS